jgi:CMP-N,N'-diacetyllegionaminic acid synthase
MNILITICARGGSKGIFKKNIKKLNGKPLIIYTINTAKQFAQKYNAHIAISTDDLEIKKIAAKNKIISEYIRPKYLASDSAGKADTIRDLLLYEENNRKIQYDFIIDLDVTSPLRTIEDIEKCFHLIKKNKNALNIFSVNISNRNPYFNMVEKKSNGFFNTIIKANYLTRQSAPKVFDLNASIYIYKRSFFDLKHFKVINENSLIYLMDHICFDLDHPIDFEFMDFLLKKNKLDFEL